MARSLCSGKGGWDSGEIETLKHWTLRCFQVCRGKGGWDSGEIETHVTEHMLYHCICSGKGGWDSGEIETENITNVQARSSIRVESVDGTQARLKHALQQLHSGHNITVERVDGTQARLKHHRNSCTEDRAR